MTLNQDIPAYRNACLDCEAVVGRMFTRKRLRTSSCYRADAVRDASCTLIPRNMIRLCTASVPGRASSRGKKKSYLTDSNPIAVLQTYPPFLGSGCAVCWHLRAPEHSSKPHH